jgi:F0F1-type ATP synthase assembly protein I
MEDYSTESSDHPMRDEWFLVVAVLLGIIALTVIVLLLLRA